nr:MAG TPA: hypothetical protein [Caudoviricetes sp.]DAO67669.1 MAG TPA: hypothetical protein [Bacteriophage sp.]
MAATPLIAASKLLPNFTDAIAPAESPADTDPTAFAVKPKALDATLPTFDKPFFIPSVFNFVSNVSLPSAKLPAPSCGTGSLAPTLNYLSTEICFKLFLSLFLFFCFFVWRHPRLF